LLEELKYPTDQRLLAIVESFRQGMKVDEIYDISKIDKWFLRGIEEIVYVEKEIADVALSLSRKVNLKADRDITEILENFFSLVGKSTWVRWKKFGFSDMQIVILFVQNVEALSRLYAKQGGKSRHDEMTMVLRRTRVKNGVKPVVKKIDTTAAEYPTPSNYLYMTYEGTSSDVAPFGADSTSVVVLGSGAYRIGSSVEFDWCAVMCSEFLKKQKMHSIVVNCNPETVSTDYNCSDKLYFEELTTERILDIYEIEQARGIVTSMGGQLPNCLTAALADAGLKLLGHSNETIENAENRQKFSDLLDRVGIAQPRWKAVKTEKELNEFIEEVGFPILVRPSFVLSGTAMKVAYNRESLDEFLSTAAEVSPAHPVVMTEFLQDNREIELDGVAYNGKILISFMSEHLENAGVHSGDSTLIYPAQKLYVETVRKVKQAGTLIAKELKLNGPFNIQFLAESNEISVIECNARASRSFPFVSKVTGINLADIATRVFTSSLNGNTVIRPYAFDEYNLPYVGVKAPMFSFARLEGADPVLGVEMASTGEVGCLGNTFEEALLLSLEATGTRVPKKGVLVSSGRLHEKLKLQDSIKILENLNIPIYATPGTAKFLTENGNKCKMLGWPGETDRQTAVSAIEEGLVDLVINVPKNHEKQELEHGARIRRTAIKYGIPLITTIEVSTAFLKALENYDEFCRAHKPILLPEMSV
ncbi:MAG: ATP-grasp domain-containing protein, partial [Oligoflexia bacterium]|nr:ATP-grasp domain-containing protein [Oligoflexia bacterium]